MSNDDEDLPFGLYERLVTAGLKARLLRFDSATSRIVTEELDAAEAHATLARHIMNVVAGVLRALPQEDRAAAQVRTRILAIYALQGLCDFTDAVSLGVAVDYHAKVENGATLHPP